ncbi:helix-turn-helix transcriptional regulator [Pseudooceanicola nanhaiensis]|uniref:helix-turn-helix transcriptional regulator n=1 Tax=Pseudooceanicola nanhaiensis TaxID=375761 RepID=UPI001CD5E7D9|nr:hypothetical protein [Pseudooceanicola nanhaiensis]MCA0919689.1 hypothetical protein [Pseudooceanicola nanhaiensis]
MARREKLAVTEKEAAFMLSLALTEFMQLVDAGALPRPVHLTPKIKRWPVDTLRAALTGANVNDGDEFET